MSRGVAREGQGMGAISPRRHHERAPEEDSLYLCLTSTSLPDRANGDQTMKNQF
ncbi:hypothetical protein DPMN_099004 [Dreissena polymorpha]|uniref:Uncharacterized protein n=1 Tax=Dreissena polymorpha TaxID=45954 RepID=A0A9D4LE50_DREPO|nr:hypothetical protein DPMN_099004 [Dreissena polymorpha]